MRPFAPGPVSRADRVRDVAGLLAEFDMAAAPTAAAATRAYADACGWVFRADEQRLAEALLARSRRRRAAQFMAKTLRDCTAFVVRREPGRTVVCSRDDDDPALAAIIADPEGAMASAEPLKCGNTATVVRVVDLVVKRYNVKNRRHAWRLRWRRSRASRAWRVGHALCLAGLAHRSDRGR